MLMKTASLVEADAEGGQAAQQGADVVHLVDAEAQSAGGYEVSARSSMKMHSSARRWYLSSRA